MTKEDRIKIYYKFGGHCAYCGKPIDYKDMQVDHLVPKHRGYDDATLEHYGIKRGTDEMDNLMPSCRACNFRKGTMTIEQFRNEIRRQCEGIIKRSFQVRQSMDYGLLEYHDIPIVFYFEKKQ